MKHVFITGCPRSGTTMLASMLGNAKDSIATPESDFFVDYIYNSLSETDKRSSKQDFLNFLSSNYRFKQWDLNANDIENIPQQFSYSDLGDIVQNTVRLFASKNKEVASNELVRIDHTPNSIKHFDTLNDLFPKSKFIFMLRDPRAIFASVKHLDWGANTSLRLAELWMEYLALYFALKKRFPERIHLTRYEDIITHPEKELTGLCEFASIPYNKDLLEGKGFQIPGYTASQHALVGQRLDKERIKKWESEIETKDVLIIESKCGALMKAFDYELTQSTKYRIKAQDKLEMLFRESVYYFKNKFRKKNREKNV